MRLNVLTLVAGLLWPLVLLAGFLLAIILLGLLAGWPLLWPAISVERGEAFDAASNCYAYVYQRPLHYVFYLSRCHANGCRRRIGRQCLCQHAPRPECLGGQLG